MPILWKKILKCSIAVIATSLLVKVEGKYQNGLETSGTIRGQLFAEAVNNAPRESIIYSPLAALIPLAKLALGSSSGTLKELLKAVGVTERGQLSSKFKPLMHSLGKLKGVSLKLTSRIYVDKSRKLKSTFTKSAKDIFQSSVEKVNFKIGSRAAQEINNMIYHDTQGMFDPKIRPDQIPDGDRSVVLVNAVNFKAEWQEPFEQAIVGDFHSVVGKEKLPFMKKISTYNFVLSKFFLTQIVEIPYQNHEASLVVLLPMNKDNGMSLLLKALKQAPHVLDKELQEMKPRKVSVTIPKFKIETELDMAKLYQKVGVQKIFTSGMSGMATCQSLIVEKAVQKFFVEIEETATNFAPTTGSETPPDAIEFRAVHPFMYFIKIGREPLFAGVFNRK